MDHRAGSGRDRAQTTIDFAIGVGIFLLAVGFAFGTAPGMIDPFSGGQEHPLVADRTVSLLAGGMFAYAEDPAVLNETCTYNFFDSTMAGDGSGCVVPYAENQSDLTTRLNLSSAYSINVSLQRDGTVLHTDGTTVSQSNIGPELAMGPAPSTVQSTITARQTVTIDGVDARVVVFVW